MLFFFKKRLIILFQVLKSQKIVISRDLIFGTKTALKDHIRSYIRQKLKEFLNFNSSFKKFPT